MVERRFRLRVIAVVMLLTGPAVAQGQQASAGEQATESHATVPRRADDTEFYMRAKLANSERVLEGLVTENFSMVEDAARQMKAISAAAHWPTTVDEVYQHHSFSFRNQCDKLIQHAQRQDLQAAHYTYLHMSTNCIDCHNYVRKKFRVEKRHHGGPVRLIPTQWDRSEQHSLPQPGDGKPSNAAERDKGT